MGVSSASDVRLAASSASAVVPVIVEQAPPAPVPDAIASPPPPTLLGDSARSPIEPRTSLAPRVRVAATNDDFFAPIWRLFESPPETPHLRAKKRLMATYGGLDALVRAYAPEQRQAYARLVQDTLGATDVGQLATNEQRLRALRTRVVDAASSAITAERTRVEASGQTFDRLGYLRARGLVAASWRMDGTNRAVRDSVPADGPSEQRAGLYNRTVPVEAELILDTRLPIAAVDRNTMGVTVMRGEDYGSQTDLAAARQTLAERDRELTAALAAEQRITSDIGVATAAIDAARGRIEAARANVAEATSRARLAEEELTRVTTLATQADTAARDAEAQRASTAARMASDLLRLDRGIDMSILFETGRAELRPESIRQLQELGAALRSDGLRGLPIIVDGHTDAQGSPDRNQLLSERRAAAVVDYLATQLAVPRDMLTSRGMGQRELKDPTHPLAEVNRRVQISIDISPQRRAELRARAAETQLAVETRAAELARVSVDASTSAVTAADAFGTAAKAVTDARAAFDQAQRDLATARARLLASETVLPPATAAVTRDRERLASAQRSVDDARPLAEGALFVNDFRANHISWLEGNPERLPERIAQALTRGFADSGDEGRAARELLRRRNLTTGTTLALDVGTVLARTEDGKSFWTVAGERLGDLFTSAQGRQVTINGYSGQGTYVTASERVPETVTPPREQIIEVELSTLPLPEPAPVLAPDSAVATGLASPDAAPQTAGRTNAPSAGALDPATAPLAPEAALNANAATEAANALREAAQQRADEARRNLERLRSEADQQRAAAATRPGPASQARSPRIELALNFARDSAVITDASALRALGPQLMSNELRGQRIFINGHTDDTGSAAHNLDLSRRRAQAVREYLLANFRIAPELLVVQGYGATRLKNAADPLAAENRRVEVVVGVQ